MLLQKKVNGYQYLFIALLPCILISLFCLIAILYNADLCFFTIPILILNFTFSKGDFAFSDFVIQNNVANFELRNVGEEIIIEY
ncbi:metalloprotease family protein [Flammeovirga pacifica]|uniref:metalloprotease family protein n=1 Tax=Flammeovirga pacifica TaxID=915059 RepID=UPI001114C59E